MKNKLYSIEYAHFYSKEIEEDVIEDVKAHLIENVRKTQSFIDIIKKTKSDNYSLCVLVDDINIKITQRDKFILSINKLLNDVNLVPDYVYFESDLSKFAEFLIERIPKKYLAEYQNELYFATKPNTQYQTRAESKNFSQFLIRKKEKDATVYSCPFLTTVWYLMRLGVPGFEAGKIMNYGRGKFISGHYIVNVLPNSYISTESQVSHLLSRIKCYNKYKEQILYYFYSNNLAENKLYKYHNLTEEIYKYEKR